VTAAVVQMRYVPGFSAFAMSGVGANPFGIAPRHADVLCGVSNAIATLPGVFGVYLTGWLLDRTGNFAAPFLLTAGLMVVGGIVYQWLGSGERRID
jgi:ACS family sodium-dependent inorganic phosphate cotransporter